MSEKEEHRQMSEEHTVDSLPDPELCYNICIYDSDNQESDLDMLRLFCKHIFHRKCIEIYQKEKEENYNCPKCNTLIMYTYDS